MRPHQQAVQWAGGRGRQRGTALIIALIFLVILTLLGITAMQTTVLQERMAGGYGDRQLAFEAAEAALIDAEDYLNQAAIGPFDGTVPGLYEEDLEEEQDEDEPRWQRVDWENSGEVRTYDGFGDDVAEDPAYIIEEVTAVVQDSPSLASDEAMATDETYRVTARATGASSDSVVMLQMEFRRQ